MFRHDGTSPLIVEHGLYSRQQIMRLLNVSSETIGQWKAAGLRACRRGTKQMFFAGRDVIRFLQSGEDDGPSDS